LQREQYLGRLKKRYACIVTFTIAIIPHAGVNDMLVVRNGLDCNFHDLILNAKDLTIIITKFKVEFFLKRSKGKGGAW
jgi:hypothetical protein